MTPLQRVVCAALVSLLGLGAQPNVTAWDILSQGAELKLPEKRKQALVAVGSVGVSPQSLKLLEWALLNDEDSMVRATAAATLGEMKAKQSIPSLKKALDDGAGEVAFQAAKALWDMGDRSPRDTLQEVMTGERKDVGGFREGAMRDAKAKLHSPRALIKIGIKEASGALLGPFSLGVTAAEEMMKDSGAPGRALSATMLGQDCDAHGLQLLEWTLKEDKNAAVKAAAARSLGRCGNADDIPKLEQYLSDGRDAVKYMSAAAIVRLSMTGAK